MYSRDFHLDHPEQVWTDLELDWNNLIIPIKLSEAEAFLLLGHFEREMHRYERSESSADLTAITRIYERLAQLIDPERASRIRKEVTQPTEQLEGQSASPPIERSNPCPEQESQASIVPDGQTCPDNQTPT